MTSTTSQAQRHQNAIVAFVLFVFVTMFFVAHIEARASESGIVPDPLAGREVLMRPWDGTHDTGQCVVWPGQIYFRFDENRRHIYQSLDLDERLRDVLETFTKRVVTSGHCTIVTVSGGSLYVDGVETVLPPKSDWVLMLKRGDTIPTFVFYPNR